MKLLLLTLSFPYLDGEQFLEGEIEILSKSFDIIYIVPLRIISSESMKLARPIPDNVQVIDITNDFSKGQRLKKIVGDNFILSSFFQIMKAAINSRLLFNPTNFNWVFEQYSKSYLNASLIEQNVNLQNIDVFYSYWGADLGLCLAILKQKIAASQHKIFVSRMHRFDLYAERSGLRKLLFQKQIISSCDFVAPCSIQGERYLKSMYANLSHKICHYYLGVASQKIINYGSSDDVLRVVSCSFMVPVKRLDLIIAALMRLERKVVWTHIGDGSEKGRILELAERLPSHIKTQFLGQLDNSEVLKYYRENPVDLFLNVSSIEGIPVSLMEALSFGIETIATDVGGVTELIKPEFGTLLRPDFDPDELLEVLKNYQKSQERRVNGQNFQRQEFSNTNYQAFVSNLYELFKSKNKLY